MRLFNKVAIIGVGLIGGSMGLALRKKGLAKEVVGFFRHRETLVKAKKKGLITKATMNLKEAVKNADLIILATPVDTIIKLATKIRRLLKKGAIIIDVGSTKLKVVKEIERILPNGVYFIGCHPLAGSDKSGPESANINIFKGSICILTPTRNTDKRALAKIKRFWQSFGAQVKILSPAEHDKIISFTSHLSHLVSFAIVDCVPEKYLQFIGSGFRDTTRLASSSPVLWRDICSSNRGEILKAISKFENSLSKFKKYLQKKKFTELEHDFARAKKRRDSY